MSGFSTAASAMLLAAASFVRGSDPTSSVRLNNGPNCVGVSSCRPRCISFRVDRSLDECNTLTGAFRQLQSDEELNPWDLNSFRTYNCLASGTCINERCGEPLPANITLRVSEEGYAGRYHSFLSLSENEDAFTFCSIYPCPKDECALPEQMGYSLQIEMVETAAIAQQSHKLKDMGDGTQFLSPESFILGLDIGLKAAFVGDVLTPDETTSFGPLQLTWMDDPSGCRRGALPYYAPVAPPSNPLIIGNNIFDHHVKESLYCSGDEYDPAPLPIESPAPSFSPTISNRPTLKPTLSPIQTSQLSGLWSFYESVNMAMITTPSHNWFSEPGSTEYCHFTGVECTSTGFVTAISLVNMNLSGSLPASVLQPLRKLSKIKLVGNKISGPFPDLSSMSHLSIIELAMNQFTGTIPESIGDFRKLRRLLIQSNQLQGTLPSSLCRLNQTLTGLDVSKNPLLFGEIPQCYGNLNLTIFRVESVGLIGPVPHGLCGTRNMNGIDPNPFGCDAIACPAGTYQPVSGRQMSDDTPCLQCQTLSNIIGSKVCKLVDGNEEITLTPTKSPMPSTSVVATPPPTQIPSSNPTSSDSILLEDKVPELTTPFHSPEHFVDFALQLDSISSLMQDQETIDAFKNVTREFIESTMSPNVEMVNVSFSSIVILSQLLEAPWNHSSVLVLNSTTPSKRLLRRTNEILSNGTADGLTVSMRISGTVAPSESPPGFSFPETMLRGFFSNMTLYLSALVDSSQFFALSTNSLAAINKPIDNEAENNNDNGRLYFGALIPLIIVACIIIAFLLLKKNTSRSLHVETYDASGPLSMMPSGSSLEDQFNDCEDPDQTSPPPPPPNHLSHCVDVHHCASSTCSSCHMSSNSSVMFVSVDEKNSTGHSKRDDLSQDSSEEYEGWIASPDEGVEWREIGGEI